MLVEKGAEKMKTWESDLIMRLTLFKTGNPVDRNLKYSVPELLNQSNVPFPIYWPEIFYPAETFSIDYLS